MDLYLRSSRDGSRPGKAAQGKLRLVELCWENNCLTIEGKGSGDRKNVPILSGHSGITDYHLVLSLDEGEVERLREEIVNPEKKICD
jgi:hypothetical protein